MRGVWGEVMVGALSLTGTRVTLMVVLWGGWLVGGGNGEVWEYEERGDNYKYASVIYLVSYPDLPSTFQEGTRLHSSPATLGSYSHLYPPDHT